MSYLNSVLSAHEDRLLSLLVQIGELESYSESLPKISSTYEDDIQTKITEHAIAIQTLNEELLQCRLNQLKTS